MIAEMYSFPYYRQKEKIQNTSHKLQNQEHISLFFASNFKEKDQTKLKN